MLTPNLTDAASVASLLSAAGITPTRSAGQNFLVCEEVVEATLASLRGGYGRQASQNHVTELGAGIGTLTQALAAAGFYVKAIERDEALAAILEKQLPKKLRERVEIVRDDLRNVDWSFDSAQDKAYQLVGNIPYNLSGWIIRRITQLDPAPERVILLVQREVAERLTAVPPNMNMLGLSVQLWGEATALLPVPVSCFWPQPKVDSNLVMLVPDADASAGGRAREDVLAAAKICFQAKRKQLGGVLKRAYGASKEDVEGWLTGVGASPQTRPQELSAAQWQQLAGEIQKEVS